MTETLTDRCHAPWCNPAKDLLNVVGGLDVGVSAAFFGGVVVIQEVNVDAVGVVLGADRGNGCDGFFGFLPGSTGHAATVVDEEDGVEFF